MTVKLLAAAAALVLGGASAAHAAPNLITNGDFETSTYTGNSEFGGAYGGQGVTGWTGNAGYNLYFQAGKSNVNAAGQYAYTGNEYLWGPNKTTTALTSPTGGAFVALDGDTTVGVQGAISQTISGLIIGASYKLDFDWGAGQVHSRFGDTTEKLAVTLGGVTQTTQTVANPDRSFTGWFHTTFYYVATATTDTVTFLSKGTPNGLPPIATLDGVSLTQVPEPASLAILGVGLLGLAARRRRASK